MPNAPAEILSAPERLRAIAESGVLENLPDEVFDRLTRLACRMTGAPMSVVTLIDKDRQVFLSQFGRPPELASKVEGPLSASYCQHVVAGAKPLVITETLTHPLVHDNDATLSGEVRAYCGIPIRAPGGELLGSFCAFHDQPYEWTTRHLEVMTDLAVAVETEIALRQSIRERERLSSMKEHLLAVVSHELRTPLTGLLGALRLRVGRDGKDGAPADPLLSIALGSAERMLRLTNDLLDFDHVERGGVEIVLARVDCREAIAAAAVSYGALAGEAGVVINVGTASGAVKADAERLHQVLGNLIGNAVKFAPKGSAIDLSVRTGDDWCEFVVRDQGRGIPTAMLEKIFEPFAQVEAADRSKKGGAGLGLAISQSLVERMGGTISATSEEGKGSAFTVRLPAWSSPA